MVKEMAKFSESEQLQMIFQGTSYAMYVASSEKEKYEKFKSGVELELSEGEIKNLSILSLLDNLGYPMDELGTYLYKDVIIELCSLLQNISERRDMDKCRNLLKQLNNGYSPFYHSIAREDKEMGVTSFHLYIQKAIDKIDENRIDKELVKSIYGDQSENFNYGLHAFIIATYSLEKYSHKDVELYKKPMIKKLSNIPDNVRLKDNV